MTDQTRDTSPEVIEAVAKAIAEEVEAICHTCKNSLGTHEISITKIEEAATAAITAYESATAPDNMKYNYRFEGYKAATAPQWSDDPPEVPGWYWGYDGKEEQHYDNDYKSFSYVRRVLPAKAVEVIRDKRGNLQYVYGGYLHDLNSMLKWSGPIQTPEGE